MSDIRTLFKEIEKYNDYPSTMLKVCGEIKGIAFFPGGKGTIDNSNEIKGRYIMVLGQDFDSETNFNKSVDQGSEDIKRNPTWRNICEILKECQINPHGCFFTNAILGIRRGNTGIGKSPGFKDLSFINYCRDFFRKQLEVQKPKLILVLGKHTAEFLAPLSPKLSVWKKIQSFQHIDNNNYQTINNVLINDNHSANFVLLVHPSFRHINIKGRRYKNLKGHDAEIEMVKEGLMK